MSSMSQSKNQLITQIYSEFPSVRFSIDYKYFVCSFFKILLSISFLKSNMNYNISDFLNRSYILNHSGQNKSK